MTNRSRSREILTVFCSSGGIGEVILQTPFYRVLRETAPGSNVTALVSVGNAQVLEGNPNIDRVVSFKGATGLIKSLLTLRAHASFDDCYVFDKSWKATCLVRAFVRAKAYRGFRRRAVEALPLTVAIRYDAQKHESAYYLALLGIQSSDDARLKPEVFAGESDTLAAEQAIGTWEAPRSRIVCFCPGGARNPMVGDEPFRRWPPERYSELARRLLDKGFYLLLVGGRDDRGIARRIVEENSSSARNRVLDLTGELPLLASGVAAGMASLVICHDSGLMHLASCFSRNMVCLFGPTSPSTLCPQVPGAQALWADEDIYDTRVRLYGTRALPRSRLAGFYQRLSVENVFAVVLRKLPSDSGASQGSSSNCKPA